MYYDGANANAIMGYARPGDMGFDLMHLNTHKTFTIPHGGGGAGHGPLGVAAHLVEYLPTPVVVRRRPTATGRASDVHIPLDFDRPKSIGPMRSFWSNFAHAVRALAYLYANGEDGLKRVSQLAVLNANYLRVKIAEFLETPYPENCRHEFVASAQAAQERTRRSRARSRKGAARLRLHGADDLLSAHRAGVLDDRADRDRIERDARRFVEALREIVEQRARRTRRHSLTRRSPRSSAASTRRAPRASPTFAGALVSDSRQYFSKG